MRRHVMTALAAGLLLAAGSPREAAEDREHDRLQGTWLLVSYDRDGKPVPARKITGTRLVIQGYQWTLEWDDISLEGVYKLDPTRKPRTIDMTFANGLDEGKILQGIYTLERDRLTLCLPHLGADRPRKFLRKPGFDVQVWKRQKGELPRGGRP